MKKETNKISSCPVVPEKIDEYYYNNIQISFVYDQEKEDSNKYIVRVYDWEKGMPQYEKTFALKEDAYKFYRNLVYSYTVNPKSEQILKESCVGYNKVVLSYNVCDRQFVVRSFTLNTTQYFPKMIRTREFVSQQAANFYYESQVMDLILNSSNE